MKMKALAAAAAAMIVTAFGAVPAAAQPPVRERTVIRHDGDRTVVRTRTIVRDDRRHYGWDRGRHRGWRNHQRSCRTVWRHHQRIRTCRTWR